MDLINQVKTLSILKSLAKTGVTSVLFMHYINAAANFGDYFIGIRRDNKIIAKTREEFFNCENLREIYNIDFKIMKEDGKIFVQIIN